MKNQILRLFFSSDLHLGFNTVSIVKNTQNKLEPKCILWRCFLLVNLLSVIFYYGSDTPNFCFDKLDELIADICPANSTFVASLERLTQRQNVSSLPVG